jgi:hypothetical protein
MKDQNGFEIHITPQEESFNRVMESFNDINLDNDNIFQELPSVYSDCENTQERIAILVNKSLGVGEFQKWPYVETQFGKFTNICTRSGNNFSTIIANLERNSNNMDFIEFLKTNIGPSNYERDLNNREDVWREIISCAIAYNLKEEEQKALVNLFSRSASNYIAIQKSFR